MPRRLSVPFYRQNKPGYCLAACAQMVLAYRGHARDQAALAGQLGIQPYVGAPARNILRLASNNQHVIVEHGDLDRLHEWLERGVPVICFIQAGELPHWRGELFQHAIVVTAIDAELVWILDPDAQEEPLAPSIDDFVLAWGELDYLYAVITDPVAGE